MKLFLCGVFLLLIITVITACKSDEIIFYEHNPSKEFYKSFNYNLSSLGSFKKDDILFVVNVKKVNQSKYFVWLGLYSNIPNKVVEVKSAVLVGNGGEKSSYFDGEYKLNEPASSTSLMKTSIKLFELNKDFIKNMVNEEGNLLLTISYVNNGELKKIEFILEKRVSKYTVFPT